jgi:Mn-dependent DtxR family transcriptional regulator
VHAEILACAKNGLIRIAEDGTLVLTDEGRRRAEKAGEEGQ